MEYSGSVVNVDFVEVERPKLSEVDQLKADVKAAQAKIGELTEEQTGLAEQIVKLQNQIVEVRSKPADKKGDKQGDKQENKKADKKDDKKGDKKGDKKDDTPAAGPGNFIADIIAEDIKSGKHEAGKIVTRFPPEPNGYLHLGHAKSICLNFGLARQFGGRTHLRFDDTNPSKEEDEYVQSIKADVAWLGGEWGDHLHFSSDYFDQYYEWALHMIRSGVAYVDSQTLVQMRENRGSVIEPGTNSPFRDRTVDENLALFDRMKNGEFKDGECVLRAKASPPS